VVHLFDSDRQTIDNLDLARGLDRPAYVRLGSQWVLNQRDDGACVFLDPDGLCAIHRQHGINAKPVACRMFPFSVRPVRGAWQASLRFDCPTAAASKGEPLAESARGLEDLLRDHAADERPDDGSVELVRGLRAAHEEFDQLVRHLTRWLNHNGRPLADRFIGAARITTTLAGATLDKVRGARFAELLDILFDALPAELRDRPAPPSPRQSGMLRQLVFAHAEHVSLAEMRGLGPRRLLHRWRQLRTARRFWRGHGEVPALPQLDIRATFDRVEAVGPAAGDVHDVHNLLHRYVQARLSARSAFGRGYYGWSILDGLTALWLSLAVTGWLARCHAASNGRDELTFDDVARGVGTMDRGATRLPALGALAERARAAYLRRDDGLARLLARYLPVMESR
jgi:Fe-S-cluster containining protein